MNVKLITLVLFAFVCSRCACKSVSHSNHMKEVSRKRVFYVDAQQGIDKNSGLNPEASWKTIQRVSSEVLEPGDQILLRRGQIWFESLKVNNDGTEDLPILFGSYGEGPRPILSGAVDVSVKDWTESRPNVWSVRLPANEQRRPERIFVAGVPLNDQLAKAQSINLQSEKEWAWEETDGGVLFIFSKTNPSKWDSNVEVNVLRRGAMLGKKNFIHIDGIEFKRFREGVWIGGSGCIISNVVSIENSFTGITIAGAGNKVLDVETSRNGVDMTPSGSHAHGLGVLVDGSENEIRNFISNDNAEDGVQTGPDAGSGNAFINAKMRGNRENCFDIKSGDQTIDGGEVLSDANTSADCLIVHKKPHHVVVKNIYASSTTKGPALTVMQGASVDVLDSNLEADESSAIVIGEGAGDRSRIIHSHVKGGGKKSKVLIDVKAGKGHIIEGNRLSLSPNTEAIRIAPETEVSFEGNSIQPIK